jgi:hypothetical protein
VHHLAVQCSYCSADSQTDVAVDSWRKETVLSRNARTVLGGSSHSPLTFPTSRHHTVTHDLSWNVSLQYGQTFSSDVAGHPIMLIPLSIHVTIPCMTKPSEILKK